MKKTIIVFCLMFGSVLFLAGSDYHQFRDIMGREFEARIVKVGNTQVTLENREGKQIDFFIADLSLGDRDYVRTYDKEHKGKALSGDGAGAGFGAGGTASGKASVIDRAIKGHVVQLVGKKMVDKPDGLNPHAQYYAIYYSAHWCPPCRRFTPELSKFYTEFRAHYNNFEVIFVSSDRSEESMEEYMNWGEMEFPALAYDKRKSTPAVTKYAGNGIPCLVVVDREGRVVADSYVNGEYVGPYVVLKKLKKLIKTNAKSRK